MSASDVCGAEGPDGLRCAMPRGCVVNHVAKGRAWPVAAPSPEETLRGLAEAVAIATPAGVLGIVRAAYDRGTRDERALAAAREAELAAEVARLRAELAAVEVALREQAETARIESVPDDGRPSSIGLRAQAAGRRQAIAAIHAALLP